MLDKKLLQLAENMRVWKQTMIANPSLLDNKEHQQKNASISKAFPEVLKALAVTGNPSPEIIAKQNSCETLLRKLHVEQTKVIMTQVHFYIKEYTHYYNIVVGQKPVSNLGGIVVSYTTSGVSALTGDVVKMLARNAIGEAVEVSLIAFCTAGGAVIGSVPGAIIGFFVGMTVDFLVNKLSKAVFGDPEKEAIADIKMQISDYMDAAEKQLSKNMDGDLAKLGTVIDKWENEIRDIVDINKLSTIEKSLKQKIQVARDLYKFYNKPNHPLGNRLLKEWVLENIGDDNDDANDYDYDVDEPIWGKAVQLLKDQGALEKTAEELTTIRHELSTSIINEELTFLSQIRNELRYTSISTKGTYLQWAKQVRNYAEQVDGDAGKIKEKFDEAQLTFYNKDIINAKNFVDQIEETYDGNLIYNYLEDLFADNIANGKLMISYRVEISLTIDQGTVVCDCYYYKIIFEEIVRGKRTSTNYTWQEAVDW